MSNSVLTFASITKKVFMALAGLFLILFLVVHLVINLFLLKGDGGATFELLAHFMATNILMKIMEVFLMGTFVIHILFGITLQIQNWMARPVRYKVVSKAETSFFSRYMIYTGAVIFIFLLIHFMNFWFIRLGLVANPMPNDGKIDFFNIAKELFTNPAYSVLYIALILLLGFHLNHAFQSGFQTLGLDHSKYTPCIKTCATIYSVLVTIGFCIIPIYFLLIYKS